MCGVENLIRVADSVPIVLGIQNQGFLIKSLHSYEYAQVGTTMSYLSMRLVKFGLLLS